MSRIRIVLVSLFSLVTLGVTVVALVSPAFRSIAYAPLRELVLPPPDPIIITVLYSTEKEAWLEQVVPMFEAAGFTVNGKPIQVVMDKLGSREMYLEVLDGAQPDLISPASSLQISILEELSRGKFGQPIVSLADAQNCRSVLETPLVLVAWKERADVLWGGNPGANLWLDLHDSLVNPSGWSIYNRPEWGYIKYGQTNPLKSNSGFMAILLMTYAYYNKTGGLTTQDILSNPEFQEWFVALQETVPVFGDSTGTYMRDIVAYGPSAYDIVAVYEASAIEQAANAVGRYGELRVYYPPATVMSDHPFCLLRGDWVTPEKAEAAEIFTNYLLSEPAQRLALMEHGFRPIESTVALDQTGSPFVRYAANGFTIQLPVEVDIPAGNVLDTLLEFWSRNVTP